MICPNIKKTPQKNVTSLLGVLLELALKDESNPASRCQVTFIYRSKYHTFASRGSPMSKARDHQSPGNVSINVVSSRIVQRDCKYRDPGDPAEGADTDGGAQGRS